MILKSTPLSSQNIKAMMDKYQQELLEFQKRSKFPQTQAHSKQEQDVRSVSVSSMPGEPAGGIPDTSAVSAMPSLSSSSPDMPAQPRPSAPPSASLASAQPQPSCTPTPSPSPQSSSPHSSPVPSPHSPLPFTPPETIIDLPPDDPDLNQGTGMPAETEEPEEPEYSYDDLERLPPAEDLEESEGRISQQLPLEEIRNRLETQSGRGTPPVVPPIASPEPRVFETPEQFPDADDLASLQIHAYTAREALPVEGAVVTITSNAPTDGKKLQYVMVTDRNGFTPPVIVPATNRNLTLAPSATEILIITYDILVSAPGFFRVRNQNVPVYRGIAAVQPVEMIPTPEMGDDGQERIYDNTSPQNL